MHSKVPSFAQEPLCPLVSIMGGLPVNVEVPIVPESFPTCESVPLLLALQCSRDLRLSLFRVCPVWEASDGTPKKIKK